MISKCCFETVRITTSARRLVSVDPLAGDLMARERDSRMSLVVSKGLGIAGVRRYFPAARTQLSDTNGYFHHHQSASNIEPEGEEGGHTLLCAIP